MKNLNILLVDDDSDDHLFFKEALKDIPILECNVTSVYNGSQALNYLLHEGIYSGAVVSMPDLIVMDINMPVMNGFKLLNIVKANPSLAAIPTYVLTTSQNKDDQEKCVQLGCNGYYVKPVSVMKLHFVLEEMLVNTLVPQYNTTTVRI